MIVAGVCKYSAGREMLLPALLFRWDVIVRIKMEIRLLWPTNIRVTSTLIHVNGLCGMIFIMDRREYGG
jgi:hypothetical protein